MKQLLSCIYFFSLFNVVSAQTFSPTNLSGLKIWYASDSAEIISGKVATLFNKNNNTINNLTQSNSTYRPSIVNNVFNNLPAIRFNGTNNYLQTTLNQTISQPNTVFIVWSVSATTVNQYQVPFGRLTSTNSPLLYYRQDVSPKRLDLNAGTYVSPAYNIGEPPFSYITTVEFNQSTSKLYENGALKWNGNAGALGIANIMLGNREGQTWYLKGDIGEVIIYDRVLTLSERNQVESYLWFKYFLTPVNLGNDTTINYGFCDSITLDATGANYVSYTWSNGSNTPTIKVGSGGQYYVTATDAFGFQSIDSITINYPAVNIPDTTICLTDTINVSPYMTGKYNYLWNTNDTNSSINISQPGLYWVKVTDTINSTCFRIDSFTVNIDSFSYHVNLPADTQNICKNDIIELETGNSLVNHFLWNPGNDTTSVKTVNLPGWYSLTASNNRGCIKHDSVYINIPGIAPVAGFSTNGFCTQDSISLNDLSTCNDGLNYWQWIINGQDTSYLQNTSFIFDTAGFYSVKLTVGSPANCFNSFTDTLEIKQNIAAGFWSHELCTGTPASFLDTSHVPLNQSLLSRKWYTNNLYAGNAAELIYAPANTPLDISLTLTLTNGCTDSVAFTMPVLSSYSFPLPFYSISPHNNQTTAPCTLPFSWNNTPQAQKYKLTIASDSAFSNIIFHSGFIYPVSQNADTVYYPFTINPNYTALYWKVTAFNPCNDSIQCPVSKVNIFNPSFFSNLKLWLSADSSVILSGNAVSKWYNIPNNTVYAEQTTSDKRPLLINNALNNRPVVRFDGVNDLLLLNLYQSYSQPNTVFIVWNVSNLTANQYQVPFTRIDTSTGCTFYWRDNNSLDINAGTYVSPAYSKTAPFSHMISTIEFNGGSTKIFENSTNKYSGNAGSNGISNFSLGNRADLTWALKGDIAEIILYNSLLSTNNRLIVENYLKQKYFPSLYIPPVNLGPDIYISYGFCDTVIKAPSGYSSYLWSTGDTVSQIPVSESGTFWVQAVDPFGVASTDTIRVFYPNYQINDTIICLGDSFNATLNLSNNYFYLWNTNDTNSSINISQAGLYWVKVTDTINNTCFKIDSFTVNIDSLEYYLKIDSDSSLCIGNKLYVSNNNGTSTNYNWLPSNDHNTQITIDHSGLYFLEATSMNGCYARDSILITSTDTAPNINFSIQNSCLSDSIFFNDLSNSSDSINNWYWDVGNNFTSVLKSPVFKYDTVGLYSLHLTVGTVSGCLNDTTSSFSIIESPKAQILFYPVCKNVETLIYDASIIPQGFNLNTRQWYLDGSYINSDSIFSYLFNDSGIYNLSLFVEIDNLCNDTYTMQIDVQNSYPLPQNFSLISPANDLTISDSIWDFLTNPSVGAIKYKLYLSFDSLFLNMYYISDFIYANPSNFFEPVHFTLGLDSLPSPVPIKIFWKIEAYNPCDNSTSSDIYFLNFITPLTIPSLKFWVTADNGVGLNNNMVTQWNDLSGNNFHLIQDVISQAPKLQNSSILGKPIVRFNGINNFMSVNFNSSFSQPNSIIILWKINGLGTHPNGYQFCFEGFENASRHILEYTGSNIQMRSGNGIFYTKSIPFNPIISSCLFNSSNSYFYENGIYKASGNTGSQSLSGLFLANSPFSSGGPYFLNGDVAEIIFYDTLLTDTQRIMIERYLMDKYQPPVCLGPDIYMQNTICDTALDAGSFYAHFQWSTGDTTHSIPIIMPGTYWVSVTDIFGRTSADTVIVNKPIFNVPDTTICFGTTLTLDPGGSAAYNYLWSTGDSTQLADLTDFGNYWVKISDAYGCQKQFDFNVYIDNYQNYASLGVDKEICNGAPLGLYMGESETVNYMWSTNDTTSTIIITTSGEYFLQAWNFRGCRMDDTINITLDGFIPHADFTVNSECMGTMMHFFSQATENPNDTVNTYLWDFGNFSFATQQDPWKVFPTSGYHDVTLLVLTAAGCEDTITKSVLVYDKPAIYFTPNNGCKGVDIDFKDFSTCIYGTPASWQWKFGDGGTASTQHPGYTYNSEGTFEVTLTTTTSHNCVDSSKRFINIKLGPEVDFEYGTACDGEEVQFTNKTFTYPWAQIIERTWDFGDSNTSVLISPTHIYTNGAGTYDVTLTVKSINGCIVPLTKQVKVNAIPSANFISGSACAKVPFQFFDLSSVDNDSIVHWLWTFGNEGSDTLRNPLFTFLAPGTYTVNLEVTSSSGCSNYIFYGMEVYPSPTASFTLTPRFGVAPLTVQFTNTSTGANAALWYFGDNGSPSTNTNPVHTYMQNGIYTVQLIATNSLGCQNSAFDVVNVIPTILDIKVKDVSINIKDNYVEVTALLENLGTRPVDRLDLVATSSNGMIFREQWQGDIQPGDTASYTFNAQFMLSDQTLDYVCVEAVTKEIENDVEQANNQFCEAVTEEFTAINTFPNPAINKVQINVIIPAENNVTLEIFDAQGNHIALLYDGVLPKGLSQFKVNIEGLRKGMYSYVVTYGDKTLVKKFIKM